jgi:hypothetical protein
MICVIQVSPPLIDAVYHGLQAIVAALSAELRAGIHVGEVLRLCT